MRQTILSFVDSIFSQSRASFCTLFEQKMHNINFCFSESKEKLKRESVRLNDLLVSLDHSDWIQSTPQIFDNRLEV